ncbi:MAG: sulfotransferase [Planctomycetota bacterium]|nr:sulfotransferase [Planctomycetota bacterium]MEC8510541.1 sulfotransferase [Planctomycetota bacterium]
MSKKNKRSARSKARATSKATSRALTGEALDRAINEALKESHEAFQRKDFARAEEISRAALKRLGREPRLISNLALSIENQNRPEDALRVAEAGLESFPEDAHLWNLRGAILKFLGELDEAREAFARAIEHDPRSHAAWRNHAGLKTFESAADPDIAAMEELLGSLPRGHDGRVLLYFALGRALDEAGETARAFEVLERANRAARGQLRFDIEDAMATMDATIAAFDEDWFARGPVEGATDASPILVVGMPRCGSTLVEQILATHSEVTGLGEVAELPLAARARARSAGLRDTSPDALATLADEDLRAIGRRYARALEKRTGGAGRPTDKYLTNYIHGGMLARAVPGARLIDVRRDPRDNAWACFKTGFTSPIPFVNAWDDIAAVMSLSRRVLDHLAAHAPHMVLQVQYEDLVDDLEGQTRRILDFLGLPFEDACLRFHETKRQVNSASALQVRQPLFRSSIGAWKPYAEHLAPMERALQQYLGPLASAS